MFRFGLARHAHVRVRYCIPGLPEEVYLKNYSCGIQTRTCGTVFPQFILRKNEHILFNFFNFFFLIAYVTIAFKVCVICAHTYRYEQVDGYDLAVISLRETSNCIRVKKDGTYDMVPVSTYSSEQSSIALSSFSQFKHQHRTT